MFKVRFIGVVRTLSHISNAGMPLTLARYCMTCSLAAWTWRALFGSFAQPSLPLLSRHLTYLIRSIRSIRLQRDCMGTFLEAYLQLVQATMAGAYMSPRCLNLIFQVRPLSHDHNACRRRMVSLDMLAIAHSHLLSRPGSG